MANEVKVIQTQGVNVELRPAEIRVNNFEKLEKRITEMAGAFKNRVYEPGDMGSLKADRTELITYSSGLDEARKAVKLAYNAPLVEFEQAINRLKAQIDEPLNEVRARIAELEVEEREIRQRKVDEFIAENAELYGLDVEDVAVQNSWSNKGSFTPKGALKKATKDEIVELMKEVAEEQKRFLADQKALENYCNERGVESSYWINALRRGQHLSEVMNDINKELARQEEARKAREQKARLEEIKQQEQQEQQVKRDPTPEPAPEPVAELAPETPEAPKQQTIKVSGDPVLIEGVADYAKSLRLQVEYIDVKIDQKEEADDIPMW